MDLIVLFFIGWAMLAFIKVLTGKKTERKRKAEIARLNIENANRKAEQQRIRDELKQRQIEAKIEIDRMIAVEREQARQARELERHEAWLEKHEEEIEKLKFRLSQAEADITHWEEQIGNLYALLDIVQAEQASALAGSKTDIKCQKKVITLNNQIHAAESRLAKARNTKAEAERKLA